MSRNSSPEDTDGGITVGGSSVFPMELTLAVAGALERLSPEQREAVVLKIYQGFKFEEMAEILACPVSTVKSRLYTALELLKAELAPIKTEVCHELLAIRFEGLLPQGAVRPGTPAGGSSTSEAAAPAGRIWTGCVSPQTALFSLREEEIPQRIGFVSDQIFEPSPWRRGWAAFWGSAARLGFASAAMLSVALVVFVGDAPGGPGLRCGNTGGGESGRSRQ